MDATVSEQPAAHVARMTTVATASAGASSAQIISGGHTPISHQIRYVQTPVELCNASNSAPNLTDTIKLFCLSLYRSFSASSGVATRFKRETPPSSYYKKMRDGEVKLVWSR